MNRLLIGLFGLATAYTVGRVGVLHAAKFTMAHGVIPSAWSASNLLLSLWYTVPVLAILLIHEGGHLVMARRYHVRCWGPYLLPFPLMFSIPFGTIGALLKFRDRPPSELAEWDIASAGILAGAVASTLCIAIGGWLSIPATFPSAPLWMPTILDWAFVRETAWHPLVAAGWLGWVLTAVSLIPIRPLDGGVLLTTLPAAWRERRWSVVCIAVVVIACLG